MAVKEAKRVSIRFLKETKLGLRSGSRVFKPGDTLNTTDAIAAAMLVDRSAEIIPDDVHRARTHKLAMEERAAVKAMRCHEITLPGNRIVRVERATRL